jgi:hypothetical protein
VSKKRESTYSSEFHRGLLAEYKDYICGVKVHGGLFQKSGLPDYVYYADASVFGVGFIGIEFKFIAKEDVPVNAKIVLEKLLSPQQRFVLHDINKKKNLGLQITFIQHAKTSYLAVVHRVTMEKNHFVAPNQIYTYQLSGMSERGIKMTNRAEAMSGGTIILPRDPGKGLLLYRYDRFLEFMNWLVSRNV